MLPDEKVLGQDNPSSWIVGPESLQVALFRPDVTETRAQFLDRKLRALFQAIENRAENVKDLQYEFRICLEPVDGNYMVLSGQEHLGSEFRVRIIPTFMQLSMTCHTAIPPDFKRFWTHYLRPLVEVATAEELEIMRTESPVHLWAAMVAESMNESSRLEGFKIGQADVRQWSLLANRRQSSCLKCLEHNRDCLLTGTKTEEPCRACCVDGISCEDTNDGTFYADIQHDLAYMRAGIRRVFVLQHENMDLLMQLVQISRDIVYRARKQR